MKLTKIVLSALLVSAPSFAAARFDCNLTHHASSANDSEDAVPSTVQGRYTLNFSDDGFWIVTTTLTGLGSDYYSGGKYRDAKPVSDYGLAGEAGGEWQTYRLPNGNNKAYFMLQYPSSKKLAEMKMGSQFHAYFGLYKKTVEFPHGMTNFWDQANCIRKE